MKPLYIDATGISPEIILDLQKNIFSIKGESRPEYVQKFYQKVFDWFEEYFNEIETQSDKSEINLEIDFDYFNSTTAKVIYDFLLLLREGFNKVVNTVCIVWYYDKMDEDMFDSGKEMESLTELNFKFEAK